MPSASSSEDYLAALKNDSKRKNHENRARLKGDPTPSDKPIPTMQESDATVFSPAPYQVEFTIPIASVIMFCFEFKTHVVARDSP